MAGDTLNADYALILRARSTAAQAKGHIAEALDYQKRYAELSKVVSDSLHKGEAHDYAARYHAQEQQLEIQQKEAQTKRMHIVLLAIAVIALLAIAFALYFFRQKRIVSEKNRVLVRMINETLQTPPPAPPLDGRGVPADTDDSSWEVSADTDGAAIPLPCREGVPEGRGGVSNSDLFKLIDTAIRSQRLYSNVTLQRQNICDRFGISRHTLNDLLTEYADGLSFPQYINAIRVEEALRLLREEPSKTVAAIAAEVGFTPANLREQFKRQYGMTPAEFLKQQEKM